MKKIFGILLLTSIGFAATAQDRYYEPYMSKTLSADAIEKVKVETEGGNITVSGSDAAAHIDVYVTPQDSKAAKMTKQEIEQKINEKYDFSVTVTGHQLTAIAKSKKRSGNWKDGLSFSFKIVVPKTTAVNLATSGGNIDLADLKSKLDFTTSGGNLTLDRVGGNVKGTTSGGNININNSADNIELTTSGGSVNAVNSRGNIKLTTSGGNVGVNNSGGIIKAVTSGGNVLGDAVDGELFASTSGGDIRLTGLTCSIEGSTSGGNIKIGMKELGKYVKLYNSSGNIYLEIPGNKGVDLHLNADKIKVNTLNAFKGDVDDKQIKGTLNGGGVPITADGGSGKINLTLK